jgi:REP element-mobilizing transposase RayT
MRAEKIDRMANTFSALHYHVVFSTKNREPWIGHESESRVWSYLAGIALENGMKPLRIGGMPDHVHALLTVPARMSVSAAVQRLKGPSSKWIHEVFPEMRGFAWQDGYGAFTAGKSQIQNVDAYIAGQREHHRVRTFQDEFLALLKRHDIEYDPRYLWG